MPRFCSAPPSRSVPPVPPSPRTASIRPCCAQVGDDRAQPLAHLRDGHVAAAGAALDAAPRSRRGPRPPGRPPREAAMSGVKYGSPRTPQSTTRTSTSLGEQLVADVGVLGALGVQGAGEADDGLAGHGHSFVTGNGGVVPSAGRWRARRPDCAGAPGAGRLDRRPHPLGGQRQVADHDAGGVGHRGAERAGGAQQRALADPLGAVGARAVVVLHGGADQLDAGRP